MLSIVEVYFQRKTDSRVDGVAQGDYLQKSVDLVESKAGDILLMHDTGGYTMSMYSMFNSLIPSPVYGVRKSSDSCYTLTCLKERESFQQTLEFWGPKEPNNV